MSVNKVILIGNVGKDPEIKLYGATKCAKFSLATQEKSKTKETHTEWHKIVAFGKLADIIEGYVKKGQLLFIQGRISTTSYAKNEATVYSTSIIAQEVKMLGKFNKDENGEPNGNTAPTEEFDTELPF